MSAFTTCGHGMTVLAGCPDCMKEKDDEIAQLKAALAIAEAFLIELSNESHNPDATGSGITLKQIRAVLGGKR